MNVKILWMYHNVMDLYGDRGNIRVLEMRCIKRGISCVVDTCAIGEAKNIADYDIVFIGGGADREQSILYNDLLSRREAIVQALNQGTFFLLICGGYQLFGQYYKDADGNMIEGLKLFDYYTEAAPSYQRCIGNIGIIANLDGKEVTLVGFENHGGQTRNVTSPLGRVLFGHGNVFQSGLEGFLEGNVLGTYLHGPLLPKNPEVADFVIARALKRQYGEVVLESLDDSFEQQAKASIVRRYKK